MLSLRARLSALSVGTLLVLLLASGAFQYFALGQYLRIDEAAALRMRFASTVQNLEVKRAAARCQVGQRADVVDNRVSQPAAQCIVDALSSPTVKAVVVDADGRVNVASDKDYPTLPLRDYLGAGQGNVRNFYTVGSGADQSLLVLRPLGSRNGHSLGVVQLSELTQPLEQTQQRLLFLLLIATGALMVLAVVVTPLLVGRALRPLRRVTEASTELAGGDYNRRVDDPATTDEVGRLARAFNEMAAAVQAAFAVRTESEEGMRHFVGDASHELRTPLTTIQGQLDILGRGAAESPERRRESIESMQREVRRMSVLVEDLLTLTRLDTAAEREGERMPVDLDRLVAEAVDEQSVRAPGQEVQVEAANPGRAVVLGNPEQLRSVVLNLANNALAHAPGGTHMWRSRVEGDEVVVSLGDDGPGIPRGDEGRLFDRFYRGAAGNRGNGSGLGLAIVRSIVEAHGGSVAASTSAGATFTVRLPLAAGDPTSVAEPGA